MRVYLAGPMTGLPELNFPAFRRAAKFLSSIGHDPVSPLDHELNDGAVDNGGEDRHLYLREDFKLLVTCDGIGLLPGWRQSVGANAELAVARMLRLKVGFFQGDMRGVVWPMMPPAPHMERLVEALGLHAIYDAVPV